MIHQLSQSNWKGRINLNHACFVSSFLSYPMGCPLNQGMICHAIWCHHKQLYTFSELRPQASWGQRQFEGGRGGYNPVKRQNMKVCSDYTCRTTTTMIHLQGSKTGKGVQVEWTQTITFQKSLMAKLRICVKEMTKRAQWCWSFWLLSHYHSLLLFINLKCKQATQKRYRSMLDWFLCSRPQMFPLSWFSHIHIRNQWRKVKSYFLLI